MKTSRIAIAIAAVAAALTLTAAAAAASEEHQEEGHRGRGEESGRGGGHGREEGDEHAGGRPPGGAIEPTYAKECGACHLAYPPGMLPAGSWRRMLGELDRHFGQNAELDEPTRARLEGWLVAGAGQARPEGGGAPQRITRLPWFVKEHRQVTAEVVARPAVRSIANCAACHQGAARWDFDEDRVTIPRG
jgi:hypothetical protein